MAYPPLRYQAAPRWHIRMHDPADNVQPIPWYCSIRLSNRTGSPSHVLIVAVRTERYIVALPVDTSGGHKMSESESFSISLYDDQTHLGERELASFISGVKELFGPEQARASTEDWLEEAETMDAPPRSTTRDWRAVTIAASARLASRIDAGQYRQKSLIKPANTKVSPIPSSNCVSSLLLF